jgi:hypothetical protein
MDVQSSRNITTFNVQWLSNGECHVVHPKFEIVVSILKQLNTYNYQQ